MNDRDPDDDVKPSEPREIVLELRPTGVMGTLTQMSLTEIMQMMDFGKKTARVGVFVDGAHGAVHVHDGQIVRATAATPAGDVYGEPAFLLLSRKNEGFFRIHYEREDVELNVHRPTTFVLLEALRTIDEAAAASPPSTAQDLEHGGGDASAFGDDGGGDSESADAAAADVGGGVDEADVPAEQLQKEPRCRCHIDVEVDGVGHVMEDIGVGGAFIGTDAPRNPGSTIHLRFVERDGFAPLELIATVMHSVDADAAVERGRSPGMGVRFDAASMSDGARDRLRALVESLAARAPLDEVGLTTAPPAAEAQPRLALPGSSVLDSLADVDFLIATGDLKGAQALLLQAQASVPDDEDVRRRLRNVNEQIVAAQAIASLQRAERLVGKPEAIEHARRAMQLRPSREVLLRALAVFAHARSHEDIAETAGRLMELDPEDEGAMRTWLDANVELRRWNVAVRTAEALLRRRPGDEQLRTLLQRLVQRARSR